MTDRHRIPSQTLEQALRPEGGCPPPERLAAAAASELPAAESESLLAHAAGCAACAAELDLARAFAAEPAASAGTDLAWVLGRLPERLSAPATAAVAKVLPMRPRPARRGFRPALWAAAASVLLAVALGLVALREARSPALPERPLEDVVRGGSIAWTTPLGVLAEAPAVLAWTAVDDPRLARYRVEILDVEERVIAGGESTEPRLSLSAGDRARLETFVGYRVRVVALDRSDRELAASPEAELRVEPAR